MTTEAWTIAPVYTVAGTGPYAIPHPYAAGAIQAFVTVAGARVLLSSVNYTLTPTAAAATGNLFLTPAAAATHAGRPLTIDRRTPDEQGWVGLQGEREKGLEAQLDRLTQSIQEVRRDAGGAVRIRGELRSFDWVIGTMPIRTADGVISGPTADQIAGAQQAAQDAAASAAQAALYDGIWFDNFAAFEADTGVRYTGTGTLVSPGKLILIRNPFAILEVTTAAASDYVWQNSAPTPVRVKATSDTINRSLLGAIYDKPIVLLWTGQSGALGGSGLSTGTRATINPYVHVYEHFVGPTTTTTGWKTAGPGTAEWAFATTGNHVGYHWADMVQRAAGRTVLLLSHAVGGTPVAEWLPSGGGISGATGFMWAALNQVFIAARATPIPGRRDGATMTSLGCAAADAMGYHQGEADANYRFPTDPSAANAAEFEQRFLSFVAAARNPAAAGSSADPMLKPYAPVLVGELLIGGTSGGSPTDDRNDALRKMGAEQALITCVPSAGLQSADNLHFDGADLVEFARRYFHAMGNLPKAPGPTVGPNLAWQVLTQPNGVVTMTRQITLNAGVTTAYTFPFSFVDANYPISISHQQATSSTASADIHQSAVGVGGLTLRNTSGTLNAIFRLTIGPWKIA